MSWSVFPCPSLLHIVPMLMLLPLLLASPTPTLPATTIRPPHHACTVRREHPHRIRNADCTEYSFDLLIGKTDLDNNGLTFKLYSRSVLINHNLTLEIWHKDCLFFKIYRQRTDATRYRVEHPTRNSIDFLFDDQLLDIVITQEGIKLTAPKFQVDQNMRIDCPLDLNTTQLINNQTYYKLNMGIRYSRKDDPEMYIEFPHYVHIEHVPEESENFYKPKETLHTRTNESSWVLPVIFVAGGLVLLILAGILIGLLVKCIHLLNSTKSDDKPNKESTKSVKSEKSEKENSVSESSKSSGTSKASAGTNEVSEKSKK